MAEYTSVSAWQVTLSGVTSIDPSNLGSACIVVKNPTGNATAYIGPAKNAAGAALSSTTGFAIEAGASIQLDLTGSPDQNSDRVFSVVGTDTQKVHVIALQS